MKKKAKAASPKRMDMNEVARLVSVLEGKSISLPIGQIKEVLRCLKFVVRENPAVWMPLQKYLAGW